MTRVLHRESKVVSLCKSHGLLDIRRGFDEGRVQRNSSLSAWSIRGILQITGFMVLGPGFPVCPLHSSGSHCSPRQIRPLLCHRGTSGGVQMRFIAHSCGRLDCDEIAVYGAIQSAPFLLRRPTVLVWSAATLGDVEEPGRSQSRQKKWDELFHGLAFSVSYHGTLDTEERCWQGDRDNPLTII